MTSPLKKIPVARVARGMYVHKICGNWLDHPCWRASFKVENGRQVEQLRGVVKEVVIDTAKGLDVEAPARQAEAAVAVLDDIEVPETPSANVAIVPDPAAIRPAPAPASLAQEIERATAIVAQAGSAMRTMFADVRMGKAVDTEHCLPLVQDITDSVTRNPGALVSLARLKTSDDYTYMHSVAVCALMVALARQLGLNEADTREAGLAGLVHDLGKALMPLDVLNKPGALTPAEFVIMKGHPEAGHRMLVEGKGAGPVALDVCLHHHEKVNGRGYPHGLAGEAISLFARMGAVCDVYDAITSNRPYKRGWDPADSIQKMAQWAREGHFDERIFQAFVKSIGIYPTGSLVKLKSGRLGVVVEQGGKSLVCPVVRVFFSTKANEPIVPQLVDLGDGSTTDQIVSRESPAAWGFKNTDQFWMPQSR
jgi:HD-GYP domain-containing protein (c-di-GMP phosphodiesterase class II)